MAAVSRHVSGLGSRPPRVRHATSRSPPVATAKVVGVLALPFQLGLVANAPRRQQARQCPAEGIATELRAFTHQVLAQVPSADARVIGDDPKDGDGVPLDLGELVGLTVLLGRLLGSTALPDAGARIDLDGEAFLAAAPVLGNVNRHGAVALRQAAQNERRLARVLDASGLLEGREGSMFSAATRLLYAWRASSDVSTTRKPRRPMLFALRKTASTLARGESASTATLNVCAESPMTTARVPGWAAWR